MVKKLRTILVGNGYFGSLYRERIMRHERYELVGVVDKDYQKLVTLGGTTVSASYDLIANSVEHDAVVICTTPQHHVDLSINAMNRGKHVLCMKPGAMSITDSTLLSETARSKQVAFVVDYTPTMSPEVRFINDIVWAYGRADTIRFDRHVVTAPKPESIVFDLLSHDVALSLRLSEPYNIELLVKATPLESGVVASIGTKDEQFLTFGASYNSTRPQKQTLARVSGNDDVTNPSVSVFWDQAQKSVTLSSQGKGVDTFFRHDPDLITCALSAFYTDTRSAEWMRPDGLSIFTDVTRILCAMQQSFENDGRIETVVL